MSREARYELVEAYKAARMLKTHAIMPILAIIALAIVQAILLAPIYNPLALSQVNPARRPQFIASSIADFFTYTTITTAVFSLLTWFFMGLATIHIARLVRSKWELFGLVIVVAAALSSIMLGYNAVVLRDAVYEASLRALSRPEIASIIANMGVHLSARDLEAYAEAIAEAMSDIKGLDAHFAIGIVAATFSAIPPLLAILAIEPLARRIESKWPRILQILLALMLLYTITSIIPSPSLALIGAILSLVNILEPIAAWLTANRIKRYVEEKLLETQ